MKLTPLAPLLGLPLALLLALTAGCAGAHSSSGPPSQSPQTSQTSQSPTVSASSDTGAAAVQTYLGAVNALCDALLPKVLAVMHGGHSGTYPVADFFAELPAHSTLLAAFDTDLAKISVPMQARTQAAALAAYIAFAKALDANRLSTAQQGQAAFDREITSEDATAANDPSIVARTAAGFSESCNAR